MKNRIVVKLFFLNSALCLLILASIFIGQTLFFEHYYAKNKVLQLSEAIDQFKQDYTKKDTDRKKLEQQFNQENNSWITVLDENGFIKETSDYYIKLDGGTTAKNGEIEYTPETYYIPIFNIINNDNDENIIEVLQEDIPYVVEVQGIEKDHVIYPYQIILGSVDSLFKNRNPFTLLNGDTDENISIWRNRLLLSKAGTKKGGDFVTMKIYGPISDIQIPTPTINYSNSVLNTMFFDKIMEFQADLLFNEQPKNAEEWEFRENGVNYKILVKSEKDQNGDRIYFFTMSSLQPINEAVQMMKDYYLYIIMAVVLLIVLASFYYSKKIADPLLRLNNTAKQIANLDFSERVAVKSNDEIGELSKNINFLSDTLHTHIKALQEDIEKERQLEITRRNFIAGVSHELKTPLSIMKSCMAILQDKVAVEKRDYYFSAMNDEVNRMDRLIVDMLELAKFESGTYTMDMEPFSINDLINHVYHQLLIKINSKKHKIQLNLEPIEVIANRQWIEQVVINFFINAIQHTPEEGTIIISAVKENDKVKITVENEGNHINPNQLEQIWDRFYQAEKNHRSKEGTGLGLAISKSILKLHQSEYGVFNTEDGVCFYFSLNRKQS